MLRTIAAIVVGYIVMAVVVVACLTLAYTALGTDRAYQQGTYEVSTLWIWIMLVVGTAAAIAGGVTCAAIATHNQYSKARNGLVLLVLLLGALSAFAQLGDEDPAPEDQVRPQSVSAAEAMAKSQTPAWVPILNPIIGVCGVIIGANTVKRRVKTRAE